MANSPFVIVLILNTNRREDTLECISSLMKSTYPHAQIIVLDNASTDGSPQAIQTAFPEVLVVSLEENKGYAGNNNVGIQIALEKQAKWVLVLNEDTTLSPNCIQELVDCGEADAKIGMVGPLVYHYDEPGVIQSAGASMNRFWQSHHTGMNESDRQQYRGVRDVDWINGCALLVRADVLHQIGGFDERFFYYNEETDLCFRARRNGWKLVVNTAAKLWHKGVKRDYSPSPSITYYGVRNQMLFLEKNRAPLHVVLYNLLGFGRTILSWTVRPKWKGKKEHRNAMIQGLKDYFARRWGMRRING